MLATNVIGRLDDLDREQLLHTARRLLAEADALSSRIAALNEISLAINRTLDLPTILRVVAKQAKWLLDFEHCSVCLQSDNPEKTDEWNITTLFGPALVPHEGSLLDTENLGRALRSAQPQLVRSGSASPVMAEYKSQIVVPLVADEMVLGTINFASIKTAFLKTNLYGENTLNIDGGKAEYQKYKLYGENRIDTRDLKSYYDAATIFGESRLKLSIQDEIKINAFGESQVTYAGNAEVSKGLIFGKTNIRRVN